MSALRILAVLALAAASAGLVYATWPDQARAGPTEARDASAGESASADAPDIVWCEQTPDRDCMPEACASGKRVIVLFEADWCGWCRHLKTKVLPDPEVQKLLSEFALIEVDSEANAELVKALEIDGYPSWLIIEKGCEQGLDAFSGTPKTPKDFTERFSVYRAP